MDDFWDFFFVNYFGVLKWKMLIMKMLFERWCWWWCSIDDENDFLGDNECVCFSFKINIFCVKRISRFYFRDFKKNLKLFVFAYSIKIHFFFKKMSSNMHIVISLLLKKNRFWEKLILIAFHFRAKIDFFW